MPTPIVLVAEELSPAAIAQLESGFEVRHVDGADRAALLPALADVDAVIVRSATRIDAEALAQAPNLRVVARAGVGLDNVDVDAATKAGVMVVNAPSSNIVSAAEHAVGLLLAVARNVPQAMASLKAGEWQRSKFTGAELHQKVAGILGLGRIGELVAQRLAAFGMQVIAYDPYVPTARAAQLGVRLVSLDELLAEADFITVHLPKNTETTGLIGERELRLVKPGVRIINAARGGIVDENALVLALKDGRVGGAGIDVFATEPPADSPLLGFPTVVATPTWAPAPTRHRRRRAPRWPGRSGSRSPASSCPTPSTCRAVRCTRTSSRGCRWRRSSAGSHRAGRRGGGPAGRAGARRDRRPRRPGDPAGRAQGCVRRRRLRGPSPT